MSEDHHESPPGVDTQRIPEESKAAAGRESPDTVGTGSYIAVSCTVMAVLATLLLIAGLLIARWIN